MMDGDPQIPPRDRTPDISEAFHLRRMIWPVLIGAGVLGYAIYSIFQEKGNPFAAVDWSWGMLGWMVLGFGLMVVRDLGYIWRMRILTDKQLSWRSAIDVTLLWEFASSLTPSVVGGSAVAIYMLSKEKISTGRSTAIVFVTIFLDELFYLVMLPLVLLLVDHSQIFGPMQENGEYGALGLGIVVSFWIAYGVIAAYTIFLAFAIFILPDKTNRVFKHIFMLPVLKRFQRRGFRAANDLEIAANEFRSKPLGYWWKAWLATFFAWMGRYLVLNCVLAAFTLLSFHEHLVAFARQAIMFVVMIVSPTPGSSGVAEVVFQNLFEEFSPAGLVLMLASIWRMITYYPYLLVGVYFLPRWLKRIYLTEEEKTEPQEEPRPIQNP